MERRWMVDVVIKFSPPFGNCIWAFGSWVLGPLKPFWVWCPGTLHRSLDLQTRSPLHFSFPFLPPILDIEHDGLGGPAAQGLGTPVRRSHRRLNLHAIRGASCSAGPGLKIVRCVKLLGYVKLRRLIALGGTRHQNKGKKKHRGVMP